MIIKSITQTTLRIIAECSLALLLAAGGVVFAHGGHNSGDHSGMGGNAGHGRCIECGAKQIGGKNVDSNYWRHHHHHHPGTGPGGLGTVHGPGSSHNPIVYHPVHGPGSTHNPIVAPVTVVRDHRGHSQSPVIPPGSVVHDHRPHHHGRPYGCRTGYWENCAWGSVHDHRS